MEVCKFILQPVRTKLYETVSSIPVSFQGHSYMSLPFVTKLKLK